jgi:hypothetical protein
MRINRAGNYQLAGGVYSSIGWEWKLVTYGGDRLAIYKDIRNIIIGSRDDTAILDQNTHNQRPGMLVRHERKRNGVFGNHIGLHL